MCRLCLNEDTQLVYRQFRAGPVHSSRALSVFKCAPVFVLLARAVQCPCVVRHIGLVEWCLRPNVDFCFSIVVLSAVRPSWCPAAVVVSSLSMLWSLCSLQENRSLQGTLRSSLTKIPYFLSSAPTSKKDSSKTILTGILITLQFLDSFPARGASYSGKKL